MADLIYLVEIGAYDPGLPGIRTLRYCSGVGYVTLPSETPANALFEPRVVQPCNFTRTAFSDARVMGGSTSGYGEIVLNNADQALCPIMNYGLDGRSCVVKVGQQGAAYSTFTVFIDGTIEQCEVGATKVTLRLRDKLMLLSIPVQQNLYLGNNVLPNGQEGNADLTGQAKPLTYGRVLYAPTVLVNSALMIYQVHDGSIAGIDGVFDGGVPLAFLANYPDLASLSLTANLPAGGKYTTCLALGLICVGGLPGKVTAHVRGDNTNTTAVPGGYVNKVAGIVKRILTQKAAIDPITFDGSFAALDASFPGEIGIYIGSGGGGGGASSAPQSTMLKPIISSQVGVGNTVQSACDAVLLTGGCWLAPTRLSTWSIGQLLAPTGTPAASFTDVDLISIDSQATNDPTAGVPVYSVYLRHRHFSGVYQIGEVHGAVSATQRAAITTEWNTVNKTDASVLTTHLLAASLYRDTCFTSAAVGSDSYNDTNAQAEATRVRDLHKVRRDFVKAAVYLDETKAQIDLGSIVQLITPRLGYSGGRSFVVVGVASDGRKNELTLDLWG